MFEELVKKGLALKKLGRHEAAIEFFKRAVEINPQYDSVWGLLGTSLDKLGRVDEAQKSFKRAVEINPQNEAAWNFLGTSLKKLGRVDEALESFYKAFDIKPNASNAFYVGTTLYDLKRYEELLDFMNVVKDICWSEHLEKLSMMAGQKVEKIASTGQKERTKAELISQKEKEQKEVKNTANAKVLLNNESLKNFVNAVGLSQEKKDFFLSEIPQMDKEERRELLKMLTKIRILELEKQEWLKKIGK